RRPAVFSGGGALPRAGRPAYALDEAAAAEAEALARPPNGRPPRGVPVRSGGRRVNRPVHAPLGASEKGPPRRRGGPFAYSEECPGLDSNQHAVSGTTPSRWRVYQFHHPGGKNGERAAPEGRVAPAGLEP